MSDKLTRPYEDLSFEEKTYEYARQWAQSRRGFIKGGAALVGGAAITSTMVGARRAMAAKSGGDLIIGRGQDSDTLDPQKTTLLAAHEIMWQIYDSLIYLDEKGTVYPGSAASWEFTNDNKTVVFKLRPGLNFHDGTAFDAEGVAWSFNRHMNPETASPTGWMYGPIDGVEVIDNMTISYHYKKLFAPLWVGLSYSYCAPVSRAAVEKYGDEYGRNPVGTGPFKFVSWVADRGIKLVRNEEHDWATPWYANQGRPYLDSVEYRVIPEEATRLAALTTGEIDVISGTESVPPDKIRRLGATPGIKTFSRPAVGVFEIMLNTKMAPFDDIRVRRAVNHAINKEKIIALALDGEGKPAHSAVASSYTQYHPKAAELDYDYDVAKAKALLKEAGVQDGLTVKMLGIDAFSNHFQIIQEDLAAVGIDMELDVYPVGEWFAIAGKGEYEITFCYYTYSDPDLIYPFFITGGGLNWSFHENQELDDLNNLQRTSFDPEIREQAIHKMQEIIIDQAYWVNLWEGTYVAAMKEEVMGLELDVVGFHHLQEVWFDT